MESYAKYAKGILEEHRLELDVKLHEHLSHQFVDLDTNYEPIAQEMMNAYTSVVTRGGKRLRGSFVLNAFKMFKDKLTDDSYKAAMAIELLHGYILVVDDFIDKSELRRGEKSAHAILRDYHIKNDLKGSSEHFGNSLAMLSAMAGLHDANNLLLSMDLDLKQLKAAISAINDVDITTCYGQVLDVYNEVREKVEESDVMKVLRYKTAYYTYHNPIQLGCILAQQPTEVIERFKGYTMPAGVAFQIQDDILGVFGDPKDTGKSNMDDIIEGKATLLTIYAKEHANSSQLEVLERGIGNRELETETFKQIQNIIIDTGSLEYSKKVALKLVTEAKEHMYNEFSEYKESDGFKFIVGIADYMIERKL